MKDRVLLSIPFILLCVGPSTAGDKVPLGSNFWPYGTIDNPWAQTKPFCDEIYDTVGAAFATLDDPWNPDFLAELAEYDHFRFMDWGKVNSSQVDEWSDRRQKTAVQDCTFQNDNVGVAYEWMTDLCNRMDADMWICVPHAVINSNGVARGSNDFIRKLAILLKHGVDMGATDLAPLEPLDTRDKAFFLSNGGVETGPALEPELKIYIEYSNETWNFAIQQSHCISNGVALGLNPKPPASGLDYTAGFMFHAWAAARLFADFEAVFGAGSDRLVRVSAVQVSGWQVGKHLEVYRSPSWNPSGIMPDAFAGTFYAGAKYYVGTNKVDVSGADTNLANVLQASLHDFYEPQWAGMRSAIDAAMVQDGRTYLMVAYEGGQHIIVNADKPDSGVMYHFYTNLLDSADNYYDVLSHYTHDGRPSSGGAWGAVKATTAAGFAYSQPTLAATIADNPKYRAILEYIASYKQALPYLIWAAGHSVGDKGDDDDNDGESNFKEFALRGNPTSAVLRAQINYGTAGAWFEYIYPRRKDGSVNYIVEASTNLVSGVWSTSGVSEAGSVSLDSDYDRVTNRVNTSNAPIRYIRLRLDG